MNKLTVSLTFASILSPSDLSWVCDWGEGSFLSISICTSVSPTSRSSVSSPSIWVLEIISWLSVFAWIDRGWGELVSRLEDEAPTCASEEEGWRLMAEVELVDEEVTELSVSWMLLDEMEVEEDWSDDCGWGGVDLLSDWELDFELESWDDSVVCIPWPVAWWNWGWS